MRVEFKDDAHDLSRNHKLNPSHNQLGLRL
jgi:hypothetical protein